jgi:deoxycytidine triphosphate deaminase
VNGADHQREYWQEPPAGEKGLTAAYWNDPWPELQGMLTAEWIAEYDRATGGMIRPLEPELLKTASYELTLGPTCVVEGQDVVLDPQSRPTLEIPPNSIALVPMRQVLCLPHYIVGRFDLQIKFIYKGLLLGTGPQVDPGFQGALSCPLHNISNAPIRIDLDEPFAKLDFAKTVPRDQAIRDAWRLIETEEELRGWLESGAAPENARLFKGGRPTWRRPIIGYLENNVRPTSSVRALRDEVRKLEDETRGEIRWFRRAGYGAVALGAITVLFAIPTFVFGVVDSAKDPLATKESLATTQGSLRNTVEDQDRQIRELRKALSKLRRQLKQRSP